MRKDAGRLFIVGFFENYVWNAGSEFLVEVGFYFTNEA